MLGEADHHSPEERAKLDQHNEKSGGGEENREVTLANQILAAVKAGNSEIIRQAASELIRMHHPETKASYDHEMQKRTMMALPQSQSFPSSP